MGRRSVTQAHSLFQNRSLKRSQIKLMGARIQLYLTDKFLVIIEACHGFASKETTNSLSITEKRHMTGHS